MKQFRLPKSGDLNSVAGPCDLLGVGDNLMASGMARGAAQRGKRIAFGDGHKIKWDQHSRMIFQRNPNIAEPGQEKTGNVEWIEFYRGNRIYNRTGPNGWIWNYDFKAIPGEVFFSRDETTFAEQFGRGFIVIEPNVPAFKSVASNKQWPVDRYEAVAAKFTTKGLRIVQFGYGGLARLRSASLMATPTFRHALAVLSRASLFVGPEGGMHHGAAAVGIPAVVIFGGFIPPAVTGYDAHTNLTGGAEACGSTKPCMHCRAAMNAISIDEVCDAASRHLKKVAA